MSAQHAETPNTETEHSQTQPSTQVSRTADRVFAVVVLLLAAGLGLAALTFPAATQDSDPGTAALPWLITAALAVLGVLLLLRPQPSAVLPPASVRRTAAAILILTVVYAGLLDVLGFIPSTFAFLCCASRLMGGRRWLQILLVSALTAAALHLLFAGLLDVHLPAGLLEGVIP
ncbi:tripartite tricarboxylate transporter TctB family protein [Nesterenkonia cremea]|uniref:DUF1468 domain-containing protein n=1 Tax=Nesterenkonia cremea TaxID=1882340 RepID=A0A917AQT3_9MICC|nr:tripartite tricarboxylate transporter TctB family protein [Nesterenkonia cremea]GGE63431.1 hypothetical protein GCM10011401_08180 [Nesterenkonia cremea]